ncbi:MAG: 50S ribosomal protein L4 [Bacteroidetes bacterium]|nr:50S ribosomal protein L4 [Bacteroidota bacterium]
MEIEVIKTNGSKTGEMVTLSPEIFEITPNDHAIYMSVRSYMANQRQGTHKTKERGEVRGGGKKPYSQKKTGNARQGTRRSPIMVGGGTIFGPKPHDYVVKLPSKVKKLARKSALSYKAKENNIIVIEDFIIGEPRTKNMVTILKALQIENKKILLLTPSSDLNIIKSGRNIKKLNILEANKASTYEILNSNILLLQKGSVEIINKTFSLN